jgi:hypothetical protein
MKTPPRATHLDFANAARLIREALRSGARVDFTKHAYDELAADHLTVLDAQHALESCRVVRREHDLKFGNWKYTVEGRSDTRTIGVVLAIDTDPLGLTIITVWEVKGRWR